MKRFDAWSQAVWFLLQLRELGIAEIRVLLARMMLRASGKCGTLKPLAGNAKFFSGERDMKGMKLIFTVSGVCLLLLLAYPIIGQETFGGLTGKATDTT